MSPVVEDWTERMGVGVVGQLGEQGYVLLHELADVVTDGVDGDCVVGCEAGRDRALYENIGRASAVFHGDEREVQAEAAERCGCQQYASNETWPAGCGPRDRDTYQPGQGCGEADYPRQSLERDVLAQMPSPFLGTRRRPPEVGRTVRDDHGEQQTGQPDGDDGQWCE